jgi:uncharacterized Tic20 family protein
VTESPQPQPTSAEPVVYEAPTQPPRIAVAPQPMLEADARLWSMLINVAAVLGIVLSGGTLSIVAILAIWLIYRERSALVDFHGKQQLNVVITGVIAAIAVVLGGLVTLGIGLFILIPAIIAYAVYIFVISIVAAVAANKGEYYRIPLIIRFIK